MKFLAFCAALLVADDPHAYEQVPTTDVVRAFDRLCITKQWRALDKAEQSKFSILKRELEFRALIAIEADIKPVADAFERCAQ